MNRVRTAVPSLRAQIKDWFVTVGAAVHVYLALFHVPRYPVNPTCSAAWLDAAGGRRAMPDWLQRGPWHDDLQLKGTMTEDAARLMVVDLWQSYSLAWRSGRKVSITLFNAMKGYSALEVAKDILALRSESFERLPTEVQKRVLAYRYKIGILGLEKDCDAVRALTMENWGDEVEL